jgi:hypothetical protein
MSPILFIAAVATTADLLVGDLAKARAGVAPCVVSAPWPTAVTTAPPAPVGHLDALALEELPHPVHVLTTLFAHGRALLLSAIGQGLCRAGGTDAPFAALQDRDARLVLLKRQLSLFGKDLLPLLGSDAPAAGLADRLGQNGAGRSQNHSEGNQAGRNR